MTQVLYRKYRPTVFGEIFGQKHIVQTFVNAIRDGQIAHAYLFCGPRGTGKTTMARLLAKSLNCESPSGAEPCNKCQSCQAINSGSAMDIMELDAASNRGINEIRELRDGVQFAPSALKYRVFIIDEAHMLTKEAFNALLKTLEEPPAHAIFILATTEAHKIPTTVASRCQRFDFRKISIEDIMENLAQIAKKEKIKCSDDALRLIAALAGGGLRDAQSLLGQIASVSSGKEIGTEMVRDILGIADMQDVCGFVDALAMGKAADALAFTNVLHLQGKDLAEFSRSLSNYLRKMMVCQIDERLVSTVAVEMTEEQKAALISQAKKFEGKKIYKIVSRFLEAENQIKYSPSPIIPLELAIIDVLEI